MSTNCLGSQEQQLYKSLMFLEFGYFMRSLKNGNQVFRFQSTILKDIGFLTLQLEKSDSAKIIKFTESLY